ncbi:hypothetical protein [Microcoleus sp. herbarium12]
MSVSGRLWPHPYSKWSIAATATQGSLAIDEMKLASDGIINRNVMWA